MNVKNDLNLVLNISINNLKDTKHFRLTDFLFSKDKASHKKD